MPVTAIVHAIKHPESAIDPTPACGAIATERTRMTTNPFVITCELCRPIVVYRAAAAKRLHTVLQDKESTK